MRKYFYSFAVILVGIFVLTACNNNADNKEKTPDSNAVSEQADKKAVEDENQGKVQAECPPMVMVGGRLYQSMGYVNSAVKCGTADGEITSFVDGSKSPEKDDESNFGSGYEYQLLDESHISVKLNGKWTIFQDIAISSWQIPSCVANFRAKVLEVSDDRVLLVKLIDIPDDFKWIFQNDKIEDIKPISLSLKNLTIYNAHKEMDIKELTDKTVRIWFDGSVKNMEPELSNPIELVGEIYKIGIEIS